MEGLFFVLGGSEKVVSGQWSVVSEEGPKVTARMVSISW